MPVLPTSQQVRLQTPQGSSGVISVDLGATGRAAQQLGQTLSSVGSQYARSVSADMQEQKAINDRYELAKARSTLLQSDAEIRRGLLDEQDYTKHAAIYQSKMEEARKSAVSLISDQNSRSLFEVDSQADIQRGLLDVDKDVRIKERDANRAYVDEVVFRNINLASSSSDPVYREQLLNATNDIIATAKARGDYSAQEEVNLRQNVMAEYGINRISSLPYSEQIKALKPYSGGGFDSVIDVILKNEGGYNPDDGKGHPVNFGINQGANPDIDVKNLTQEQAKVIYKERYWDKNNMDSVPKQVQDIVFDGVINHRSDFSKRLVDASKNGATRSELIDMRAKEYNRLAKNNPNAYGKYLSGWMKRINNFDAAENPDARLVDFIPQNQRLQLFERANADLGREVASEAKQYEDAVARGIKINTEQLNVLADKAASINGGKLSESIRTLSAMQDNATAFANQGVEQNQKILKSLEQDVAKDITKKPLLDMYASIYANKVKAIKENPWEYFESRGDIKPSGNILSAAPNDLGNIIDSRRASIQTIQKQQGVNMEILTPDEIKQAKDIFSSGTIDQKTQVVSRISNSLTARERFLVSGKISKAPLLSAALRVTDPATIQRVIAGENVSIKVPNADIKAKIYEELDGYFRNADEIALAEKAVTNYYKSVQAEQDLSSDKVDADLLSESFSKVVGNMHSISATSNGQSKVLLPNNVDADELEDRLYDLTDEDIIALNGALPKTLDGTNLTAKDIRLHAKYYSSEGGKLVPFINGSDVFINSDGSKFSIDPRKLLDLPSKTKNKSFFEQGKL